MTTRADQSITRNILSALRAFLGARLLTQFGDRIDQHKCARCDAEQGDLSFTHPRVFGAPRYWEAWAGTASISVVFLERFDTATD